MIEDGEQFFETHPDPETRQRGLMLIHVIDGLRDSIQKASVARPPRKLATLREFEEQLILDTLQEQDWSITRAAKALDIDRKAGYRLVKRYGLRKHFPLKQQHIKQ